MCVYEWLYTNELDDHYFRFSFAIINRNTLFLSNSLIQTVEGMK